MKKIQITGISLGLIAVISACQAPIDDHSAHIVPGKSVCVKGKLHTLKPGRLIIATSQPAYAPWIIDDNPSNGKGLESAVIDAVAHELGYSRSEITWVRQPFVTMFSPGKKPFDLGISQITINDDRKRHIDFSSPYFTSVQVLVMKKSNRFAQVRALKGLADATIGAMNFSTAVTILNRAVHFSSKPRVFDTNLDGVIALNNGQIDALLVDSATAQRMVASQIDDGHILGALPQGLYPPEELGIALDKGSPLTSCTSWAIDRIRSSGVLARLVKTWIGSITIKQLQP